MIDATADNLLGFHLLNDCQRNFPLCPAPFAELAARLGVAESAVLRMLEQLRREGRISRVGAVFAPKRIGASTLAAMAVPTSRLGSAVEAVNRFPEVNHTVARDHRYNLWFVVTAGSEARLQAALGAIEQAAGYPLLRLPIMGEFHGAQQTTQEGAPVTVPTVLDEIERRLVMALQEGLPLFIRPFAVLASRVGCEEGEVLERIRRWCAEGVIKRFGVVVRAGGAAELADALLVQDIPDQESARIGNLLAGEPGVALCYLRPRVLPEWPYNVFCMVHGVSREEVCARIVALRETLGLSACAHDVLFSLARFGRSTA